jgi:valyl-tRNA synthetase
MTCKEKLLTLDTGKIKNFLQRLITAVRTIRSEMRIPPEKKAELVIAHCNSEHRSIGSTPIWLWSSHTR